MCSALGVFVFFSFGLRLVNVFRMVGLGLEL